LPRFRDIAGFLLKTATPPLFHLNFGGVHIGLLCRCWGDPRTENDNVAAKTGNVYISGTLKCTIEISKAKLEVFDHGELEETVPGLL